MEDIELIRSKFKDLKCEDSYVFLAISNIEEQLNLLKSLQDTLYSTDLYIVYKHTSPSGKVYIGITKNLPGTRWNEGSGYESQKKFYKAIQKFGWINFKHEIVAAGLSEDDAKLLESKLILKYKSNEEEFGYNTQVLHNIKETVKNSKNDESGKKRNYTEIAKEFIDNYSIKTVNDCIYYFNDNKYICEKDYPFIKKELLIKYGIEAKKHKEIIQQIKILSFTKKEDVFFEEKHQCLENNDISKFFYELDFDKFIDFYISDTELYSRYLSWCGEKDSAITDKDFFRKCPAWMNKYRQDVERVVSDTKKGWELRSIVLDEVSGKMLTSKGIKLISTWAANTDEIYVCVQMICEKALGISLNGSRKIGNEICFIMRNVIPGWKDAGVMRTKQYGCQLCFKRSE